MTTSLYDIPLNTLSGQPTSLGPYRGQVLLIVNVASQCGLTLQYAGLETLFVRYREQGLQVLGFPCNDFAGQEPGSAEEIATFCTTKFGVQFPLFAKTAINSAPRHPLYTHLIAAQPRNTFPNDSDFIETSASTTCCPSKRATCCGTSRSSWSAVMARVLQRFSPDTRPDDASLVAAIEAALAQNR